MDSSEIQNGTIAAVDIANNTITATQIAAGAVAPSELLNSGDFTMNSLTLNSGRSLTLGNGAQRIYGDNSTAIYLDSNHSTQTQIILRDLEDTQYGRFVGGSNGATIAINT